jgi:branched-chain amino acid transport system substrate-binding protein
MKKLLSLLLAMVMVFAAVGCAAEPATPSAAPVETSAGTEQTAAPEAPAGEKVIPDVIKIGMVGTISGEQAVDGQNMTDAITLVQEELAAQGGLDVDGKKVQVEFVIEDTEAKPEIASNAVQKLIEQDGVLAILGPNNSSDILACGEIAQAAQVPEISNTATNIKVTQIGDYIFRSCFIDPFQGKVVAKFAWEDLGAKKAAVLYNNADAYSTGLQEAFVEAFKANGGEIVATEAFAGAEVKDYSAQLTKIQNANPDVIFYPSQISMIPLQLQQTRAMGITVPMLGCDSWDYDYMPSLVGEDVVEGSYYVTGFSPDADTAKEFVDAFNTRFGYRPSFCSAMMYEAAHILLNAIQNAATIDGPGVRDAIAATDMDLPSGHVVYDENRNPIKSGTVLQVVDGQRVFVKSITID